MSLHFYNEKNSNDNHNCVGRCLWGDDCRFAHEVPEGEEMGRERSERTRGRGKALLHFSTDDFKIIS